MMAKTISYCCQSWVMPMLMEAFIAWYSGAHFQWHFFQWRMTGSPAWMFWLIVLFNVLIPLAVRLQEGQYQLYFVVLYFAPDQCGDVVGACCSSSIHPPPMIFSPQNWGDYQPTWVELSITLGSFSFFFLWFFVFSKFLPTIPVSELKTRIVERETGPAERCQVHIKPSADKDAAHPSVMAVFSNAGRVLEAVKSACDAGYHDMETFSPVKLDEVEHVMRQPKSPVRFWTLAGALAGLTGGFALAIGTSQVNNLIVGGKPAVSLIPFCVIGFEGTILLGCVANLIGLVLHARLFRQRLSPFYDHRFSRDRFGLLIRCTPIQLGHLQGLLEKSAPEEVHVHQ